MDESPTFLFRFDSEEARVPRHATQRATQHILGREEFQVTSFSTKTGVRQLATCRPTTVEQLATFRGPIILIVPSRQNE